MSRQPHFLFKNYTWFVVCLALVACSGPTKEDANQGAIHKPVWPKPPAQARIEFVQDITKPEDIGIMPGLWSRLASIFVGKQETRLIRPTATVVTSDEVLYVADPGQKVIHRFDTRQKQHDMLSPEGDLAFRSPVGLSFDPTGDRVYVSDSALNQIFVIDRGAEYPIPFKTSIGLAQPTGLSFDAVRGRLYVVNTRQHEVLAFNPEGDLLFRFGTRGAGVAQFNYPTQIWSDPTSGELWVTDSLNFRVQRFTKDGQFLSTFSGVGDATGNLARPKGVATDRYGHIYIVDALLNNLQIFNKQGELLLYLGEQGRGIGQFWLPVGIFIDGKNHIYVADSFNNRVQVFRYLEDKG
jgi:DNA-binding beta-propeller fold protein YncE